MSFPKDFLTEIAHEKELTEKETEVFLSLLRDGKSRVEISTALHIGESVVSTRLSGVYKKFQIDASGPVKESRLKDYLTDRYRRWKSADLGNSSVDSDVEQDIDALVREVRQRVQPYIQERCGTMRVLDMTQPVALGDIYTSVNILEKITGRRGLELAELMRDVSPEKFERFCLGDVRERRVPGLEAVETFSKLMILGKPGAGKTTFLKHLGIQCIGGKFQGERVPVFITLKDFAEADGKPKLLEYITRLVTHNLAEIPPTPLTKGGYEEGLVPPLKRGARGDLQPILNAGRALVLLDGLDEVRDADSSQVLRQIQEFSQQFPQNQFVITCRIAAKEYTFEKFTEVEIADFDDKQIADFSGKWFRSKNDPIKAKSFLQKLKEDAPIRELATNPLLLTLLCLVFEDSGSFPTNRAELYQMGVDVLLKKWDVKRNIEREQVYKRLSLKRKEDLLSQIARTTFEAGNYFFKQREVERYINQYIQNLPDASTDPEALELDSAAVLKSIEAQHGLLVERARGIYSFSHLTFHEYFTARQIVTSCNPYAAHDPTLQGLVSHVTEKRWREVFLLIVEMLSSADELLQLMKHQIDKLLTNDEKVQQLLERIYKIYSSQEFPFHFPVPLFSFKSISLSNLVVHSLYFECELRYIHDIALGLEIEQYQNQYKTIDLYSCYSVLFSRKYALKVNRDIALRLEPKLRRASTKHMDSTFSNPIALKLFKLLDPVKRPTIYKIYEDENNQKNSSIFGAERAWWKTHGSSWNREFKSFIAKYRSQLNAKQLSKEHREKLRKYYDANVLLLDCLNSDCNVSPEVKKEIEKTLLWPIAEIERRKKMKDES